MGASQSKQSPPSAVSAVENAAPPSMATVSTNNNTTTSNNDSVSTKEQSNGGGCPMKNIDGSYRIMPGFASLFGKMAGHPPVDVSKIKVANDAQDVSTSTANTTTDSNSNVTDSTVQQSIGCPVKNGSSSSSWNSTFSMRHLTSSVVPHSL